MDITLNDKVAIVTGGTRGIGFAMVKKFIEAKAKVAIWGSRKETAEAALEKLKEIYPDCDAMAMAPALTDQKQVREAMEAVVSRYGRIDILANNAGISQSIPLENYTDEDLDRIIDLNIRVVFVCCKAAAANMKEEYTYDILEGSWYHVMVPDKGKSNTIIITVDPILIWVSHSVLSSLV